MRGLESVGTFIYRTATAVDQNDILEALSAKMKYSKQVAETFKQTGLTESMYEWGGRRSCCVLSATQWTEVDQNVKTRPEACTVLIISFQTELKETDQKNNWKNW